jgi:hypothetical protein
VIASQWTPRDTADGQPYPLGLSGDPLLKRLVALADLGWRARLVVVSNGTLLVGTLVSPDAFRAALADKVRRRSPDERWYEVLDEMVASAITHDDPDPTPLGSPGDVPEPRFVHLADVALDRARLPYLRLRLPAVSGFWLESVTEPDRSEPVSEGR